VSLINGDANGDNNIGALDQYIVRTDWNQPLPSNPNADLNGDGSVGALDLYIVKRNWNTPGN
jgi:hypothetical protein